MYARFIGSTQLTVHHKGNKPKIARAQHLNLSENVNYIFPKHECMRSLLDHKTEYAYYKDQPDLTRFGLKLPSSPGFLEFSSSFIYMSTVNFLPVQFTSGFSLLIVV